MTILINISSSYGTVMLRLSFGGLGGVVSSLFGASYGPVEAFWGLLGGLLGTSWDLFGGLLGVSECFAGIILGLLEVDLTLNIILERSNFSEVPSWNGVSVDFF